MQKSATQTMRLAETGTKTGASGRTLAGRILWMAWIPLTLYMVFFAPIPDIHDGMHTLRHSTTIVQCH